MEIAAAQAIVTGGASGLGLATARRLIKMGADVALFDLPSSRGEAIAAELSDGASFWPVDVTDEEQVARSVEAVAERGPLRVVINCAGIATPGKLVGRDGPLALAAFMRVVNINLAGTVIVSAHAAREMQKVDPVGEERGVIINTASVAAFDGQIGQIAYAASKGAVAAMTLPAARELAGSLIRVVTIAPGLFETPMMAGLPESAQQSLAGKAPHPSRLGKADEFAHLAEHIIRNPMLNGETIRLDGAVRLEPR